MNRHATIFSVLSVFISGAVHDVNRRHELYWIASYNRAFAISLRSQESFSPLLRRPSRLPGDRGDFVEKQLISIEFFLPVVIFASSGVRGGRYALLIVVLAIVVLTNEPTIITLHLVWMASEALQTWLRASHQRT